MQIPMENNFKKWNDIWKDTGRKNALRIGSLQSKLFDAVMALIIVELIFIISIV